MSERIYIIVGIFLFILGARNIISIYLNDNIATQSINYNKVNQETEMVKVKNQTLRNDIYYYEALTTIASEAAHLGFGLENEYYILR